MEDSLGSTDSTLQRSLHHAKYLDQSRGKDIEGLSRVARGSGDQEQKIKWWSLPDLFEHVLSRCHRCGHCKRVKLSSTNSHRIPFFDIKIFTPSKPGTAMPQGMEPSEPSKWQKALDHVKVCIPSFFRKEITLTCPGSVRGQRLRCMH